MKKTNKQIVAEIRSLLDELDTSGDSTSGEVKRVVKTNADKDYSGCIGGLRLLLNENFFDQPRSKQEATTKLMEMGRHYTSPSISMNLLNLCRERALVKLGDRGNYKFVIRK